MRAKIIYKDKKNRIRLNCDGYLSMKEAMDCLLELAKIEELEELRRQEEAEMEAEMRKEKAEMDAETWG